MGTAQRRTDIPVEYRLAHTEDITRIEFTISVYLPPVGWQSYDDDCPRLGDLDSVDIFERVMLGEIVYSGSSTWGEYTIPYFQINYSVWRSQGKRMVEVDGVPIHLGSSPGRGQQKFFEKVVRPEANRWARQLARADYGKKIWINADLWWKNA